ncbi:MAG: cytochrome c [Planctomycetia bacterium]
MAVSRPFQRLMIPLLACLALATDASSAFGQFGRPRPSGPAPRSKPPASWPPAIADQFFSNAFDTLDGPRPDFTSIRPANADGAAPAGPPSAGVGNGGGDGAWSQLISGDTLVDEIKSMKGVIAKAIDKKGDFTRGSYKDARNGFSTIAAAFGVMAAHQDDVRWKKSAARARDVFSRVAVDCGQGSNDAFASATKGAEDLETLLEGGTLQGPTAAAMPWHRIAARPPLMWRLEEAEKLIAAAIASESAFGQSAERLAHEAEVVAMIGEFVRQPEFEFFDDDTYRNYAATMRDAADRTAAAARKGDFAAASSAVSGLRKACTDCHGDYR